MTGTIEQPKHTGASAAWPEASTTLVQADDILTPEELAAYAFSLRSPRGSRNRGSSCPTPGSTRRPAGAAAVYEVPLHLLRGTQPGRFHACVSGATCDSIGCPWFAYSGDMAGRPAPRMARPARPNPPTSRKASRPVSPTGLKQTGRALPSHYEGICGVTSARSRLRDHVNVWPSSTRRKFTG